MSRQNGDAFRKACVQYAQQNALDGVRYLVEQKGRDFAIRFLRRLESDIMEAGPKPVEVMLMRAGDEQRHGG